MQSTAIQNSALNFAPVAKRSENFPYENMALLRKRRGMTQLELGSEMDLDINTISRMELGKIDWSIKRLLEWCDVMEMNPADVFNFNPKTMEVSDQEEIYDTRKSLKKCKEDLQKAQALVTDLSSENRYLRRQVEG